MTLHSAKKRLYIFFGGRLYVLSNAPTYFLEVGSLISLCNVVIMGSFKSSQCCDFGSSLIGGSLGSLWRCGLYQVFEVHGYLESSSLPRHKFSHIYTYIYAGGNFMFSWTKTITYLCKWQLHISIDLSNVSFNTCGTFISLLTKQCSPTHQATLSQ